MTAFDPYMDVDDKVLRYMLLGSGGAFLLPQTLRPKTYLLSKRTPNLHRAYNSPQIFDIGDKYPAPQIYELGGPVWAKAGSLTGNSSEITLVECLKSLEESLFSATWLTRPGRKPLELIRGKSSFEAVPHAGSAAWMADLALFLVFKNLEDF